MENNQLLTAERKSVEPLWKQNSAIMWKTAKTSVQLKEHHLEKVQNQSKK